MFDSWCRASWMRFCTSRTDRTSCVFSTTSTTCSDTPRPLPRPASLRLLWLGRLITVAENRGEEPAALKAKLGRVFGCTPPPPYLGVLLPFRLWPVLHVITIFSENRGEELAVLKAESGRVFDSSPPLVTHAVTSVPGYPSSFSSVTDPPRDHHLLRESEKNWLFRRWKYGTGPGVWLVGRFSRLLYVSELLWDEITSSILSHLLPTDPHDHYTVVHHLREPENRRPFGSWN